MGIVRVECIAVTTPLVKPIIIATTTISQVDSIALKIVTDNGIVGIADSGGPRYERGKMFAPEWPGLGVELNEALIAEHLSRGFSTRIGSA
jgi:L-alanine-DL-glutamate epimerase-like enolase superfamily enzyme